MLLDSEIYENARQSRDPRFDGRFFVGVVTTGIYCRPVCPVKIPMKKNVQLYSTAAAAAAAGFRPCLRCRPESSPGTPAWSGSSWKVSRALQLIDQGFLDDSSVAELAQTIEVGPRQLGRLFKEHIGASPIEVAQTRRLHFAKKLIDETHLSLAEICFAAGFGSIRRFNAVFVNTYNRSPSELRERLKKSSENAAAISISLNYRPPFNWRAMLAFLKYRHIPGVEFVTETSYSRTIWLEGEVGEIEIKFIDQSNSLTLSIDFPKSNQLYHIVERVKSMFDLQADSNQIQSFFASDSILKPMVKNHSGLRVPGCWDGFEVAVRAILGQQVTVAAATTLAGRIAEKYGTHYVGSNPKLTRIFPSAEQLSNSDFSNMGIVGQRIHAIRQVAEKVKTSDLSISPSSATPAFVEKICEIKGIGEWTAYYIAMRALRDPDAFPFSDLILRRAACTRGETLTPKQLLTLSENWKPWRAYAVILLWAHYGEKMTERETSKRKSK